MGRSCTDQIASLHIIVEQSVGWQSSVYICFEDFAKVFHSITETYYLTSSENFKKASKQRLFTMDMTESFDMLTGIRK